MILIANNIRALDFTRASKSVPNNEYHIRDAARATAGHPIIKMLSAYSGMITISNSMIVSYLGEAAFATSAS